MSSLKQKEMKDENIQDYIHEMSKPLARYKDDEDLDKIMREMEREGDPMAAFMKKKSKIDDNLNGKHVVYLHCIMQQVFFFIQCVSHFKKNSHSKILFLLFMAK